MHQESPVDNKMWMKKAMNQEKLCGYLVLDHVRKKSPDFPMYECEF